MKFQPQSEEDIAESNLISPGDYPFEVTKATDKTSKNGNDMVELQINVTDNEDRTRGVFDYLVSIESMAYKIRHFAEAVGMLGNYEQGEMKADDMVGCAGKCRIAIQPAKDGYAAKNVVKDYLKRESAVVSAKNIDSKKAVVKKAIDDDFDDSIPF